jgi:hypothetical protein|nr:hypothetical protein [Candidatus Cloacimonadota bacterium]
MLSSYVAEGYLIHSIIQSHDRVWITVERYISLLVAMIIFVSLLFVACTCEYAFALDTTYRGSKGNWKRYNQVYPWKDKTMLVF